MRTRPPRNCSKALGQALSVLACLGLGVASESVRPRQDEGLSHPSAQRRVVGCGRLQASCHPSSPNPLLSFLSSVGLRCFLSGAGDLGATALLPFHDSNVLSSGFLTAPTPHRHTPKPLVTRKKAGTQL